MIDLSLLRVLKNRKRFEKVYNYIPKADIDKKTVAIIQDIKKYFDKYPEEEVIDIASFRTLFFLNRKKLKDVEKDFYNKLIDKMRTEPPEDVADSIINTLLELEFATSIGNTLDKYNNGDEVDLINQVDTLTKLVKEKIEQSNTFEFAEFDEGTEIMDYDNVGYSWPLKCMNETYRPLAGGDQYIVAARPGKGKTSFLTFTIAAIAQEMPINKKIVWFNNESKRARIMGRMIQSALKKTTSELKVLREEGTLKDEYTKVMGTLDRVQVYDIHGKSNLFLERILESVGDVGMIIFDMLDNVQFAIGKNAREDSRLEELYKWSREQAVKYDAISIPTSQISNEGVDLLFPPESALKESKTGKQGACDGIIMIGCSNDPLEQNKRGISMPKTKSKLEGVMDMREEILFDADRGVYRG